MTRTIFRILNYLGDNKRLMIIHHVDLWRFNKTKMQKLYKGKINISSRKIVLIVQLLHKLSNKEESY